MLVAIMCFDKPNHVDLRAHTRPEHLAWLGNSGKKVHFAGPMLDDAGQSPLGSLFVIEFESLDEARVFHKSDPYARVGLFERVVIHPTRKVFPAD